MIELRNRTLSLAAIGLAGTMTLGALGSDAHAQENNLQIGVYDPETVFNAYHGRDAFMQRFEELQMEGQQAQQEGNQQRLMEIQQELQEAQQEVVADFQDSVEEVMEEVAQEHEVTLVAVEVVYAEQGIEQQDVTEAVIEKVNEGHDVEQPEMMIPDMAPPEDGDQEGQGGQAPPQY